MNIEELRKQPHLSASSINDFIECGLQWKFNRIDRIEPEYTAANLLFGSTIHQTLESYYQTKMKNETLPLDKIHSIFENCWIEKVSNTETIGYKDGDDYETLLQKGKDLLTAWYENRPNDHYQVLATEQPFSFHIEGVPVPIIGVMDLIERDESGNIIITDFKTACRAYSKDDVDKNLQLTVYHMAAKQNGFADAEIILKFDCLIKTKTPKFEQYYTVRNEVDEYRLTKKIKHVWHGIQKGVYIPNDSSWKCGYCQFKNHCDQWFLQ